MYGNLLELSRLRGPSKPSDCCVFPCVLEVPPYFLQIITPITLVDTVLVHELILRIEYRFPNESVSIAQCAVFDLSDTLQIGQASALTICLVPHVGSSGHEWVDSVLQLFEFQGEELN